MERQLKQKKITIAFIIFLLLMWIFTLISKSIYASKLPQVSYTVPEKKSIEHLVEADGIIKQGSDVAIHTMEGIRVEKIFVKPGDTVEKDSPLFQLDKEDLEEIIEKKKLEIAKMEYEISDLQKNKSLLEAEKQKDIERAKEDYSGAENKADTTLDRADKALNQADSKLKNHINNGAGVTSDSDKQKAYDSYNKWLKQGEELTSTVSGNQISITENEKKVTEAEKQGNQEEINAAKAALEEAKNKLKEAQKALTQHNQNAVTKPDFDSEDMKKQAWEENKESLENNLKSAQYGKEDAQQGKQDALLNADRQLEDAMTPEQADSTLQIYQMQLKQTKKDLEKYKDISNNDGNVCMEKDGTITKINLTVGERTVDGTAIVCADAEVPFQFETTLTKEQKKYINQGDEIQLKTAKGKKDLQIDYLMEEENNPGSYRAVVYLPEGDGVLGMSGTLTGSQLSESYQCCIPIDALYSENDGTRYFVYLIEERDGILGTELHAAVRYVKVLDQNDRYAALEDGSIGREESVIISADKEFGKNSVIRIME